MSLQYLKNRDIILFSLKSWDSEIGTSSVKYAEVFAKNNNRVLFVNRSLDRASIYIHKNDPKTQSRLKVLKSPENRLRKHDNNTWILSPAVIVESINMFPKGKIFDFFNRINNKRLAREINKATAELGFKNCVLYIENDFVRGFYLKELLNNIDKTVYYIRDYLRSQDYFKKHGSHVEPRMIAKADVVSCNSEYLTSYAREFNKNAFFVGQGVDHNIFADKPYEMPADMRNIVRPVVGYVGALITTRLDINLIREIALARADWQIVLVGPEDPDFKASDLHSIKNIHFLGPKKLTELAPYIAHFDVCINPQLKNEMTIGNYPLKIDEYLTQGKPIVATRTLGMKMFEEFVSLCDDSRGYVDAIAGELERKQSEEIVSARKEFAKSHTWENCVANLDSAIVKVNLQS